MESDLGHGKSRKINQMVAAAFWPIVIVFGRYMSVCRLLTPIRLTCYTIENEIVRMQMSQKKKEHNVIHKKYALS